jgi:putative sterol carrier protein
MLGAIREESTMTDSDLPMDFGASTPEELAELIEGLNDADITAAVVQLGVDAVLDRVFEAMAGRFIAERAQGLRAVIQWDVHTPEGTRSHQLHVESPTCAARRGGDAPPQVTLAAPVATVLRIFAGRLSGLQARSDGSLEVTGDVAMALRQQLWFDADLSRAELSVSTPGELARLLEGRTDAEIEAGIQVTGTDRALGRVFSGMVAHFLPEKAKRKPAVVEFVIRTPDGERTYQFVADRAGARYHQGRVDKPNVKLQMRFPDFLRMAAGRLDSIRAFTHGKVRVRGNLLLARKIPGWFDMRSARPS